MGSSAPNSIFLEHKRLSIALSVDLWKSNGRSCLLPTRVSRGTRSEICARFVSIDGPRNDLFNASGISGHDGTGNVFHVMLARYARSNNFGNRVLEPLFNLSQTLDPHSAGISVAMAPPRTPASNPTPTSVCTTSCKLGTLLINRRRPHVIHSIQLHYETSCGLSCAESCYKQPTIASTFSGPLAL